MNIFRSISWKFSERIITQVISTILSVILARLLNPSDYGNISIVMVFVTLANTFIYDGLSSSLIQKKEVDEIDYFSALYFNIFISLIIYFIIYFFSPAISFFLSSTNNELELILKVISLRIILNSILSIEESYMYRNSMYDKLFVTSVISNFLSATTGIVMAIKNFGVWSIVVQNVFSSLLSTLMLFFFIRKKIKCIFSFNRLKTMLNFGTDIFLSNLLITSFQEIRTLAIAKFYPSSSLAFYDKGKQFPNVFITNINTTIKTVLFPELSKLQNDKIKLKEMMRKSIKLESYIIFPFMFGLASIAKRLVLFLLTDKWSESIPLLQIFCLFYLFQPIHTVNIEAIKSVGKSKIILALEILKKAIELIVLIVLIKTSVNIIALSSAILSVLFVFINSYPSSILLNYSFAEQFKDVLPSLSISLVMFIVVYTIGFINLNNLVVLLMQISAGILIYVVLSIFSRNEEFYYIVKKITK